MKLPRPRTRPSARSGFTLLEVTLTATFLAVMLLASSAAFAANLRAVETAERLTGGALFMETVMEDVWAQDYANLLALNGNRILDDVDLASSNFAADLTVFQAGADRIQIRCVLTDLVTNEELGRVTSVRVDR